MTAAIRENATNLRSFVVSPSVASEGLQEWRDSVAGLGTVSIRTQPKGAQIAINNRLLDHLSPTEFLIGPGNYVVDMTLTGFKPAHKIITVEKGGKVLVDEVLERQ